MRGVMSSRGAVNWNSRGSAREFHAGQHSTSSLYSVGAHACCTIKSCWQAGGKMSWARYRRREVKLLRRRNDATTTAYYLSLAFFVIATETNLLSRATVFYCCVCEKMKKSPTLLLHSAGFLWAGGNLINFVFLLRIGYLIETQLSYEINNRKEKKNKLKFYELSE